MPTGNEFTATYMLHKRAVWQTKRRNPQSDCRMRNSNLSHRWNKWNVKSDSTPHLIKSNKTHGQLMTSRSCNQYPCKRVCQQRITKHYNWKHKSVHTHVCTTILTMCCIATAKPTSSTLHDGLRIPSLRKLVLRMTSPSWGTSNVLRGCWERQPITIRIEQCGLTTVIDTAMHYWAVAILVD